MEEKIKIYESDYLAYELMPDTNIEFVSKEFIYIEELVKNESEWESCPEWLEYLSDRPIGNKPNKANLNMAEFCNFLLDNNLSKIQEIEIIADERGAYADKIKTSEIFGNSIYAVVFSGQNDTVEQLCIIPLEQDDIIIVGQFGTLVKFILDKYNLIIVNWNDRKIN